jgi:eukaryotic-like serine/threonine-protein kinase
MGETTQQFGKYRILGELGRGGFGTVYRAVDTTLEREVALKILHPQLLSDAGFVQRFRQEARTLASLRHPQVVTVYEVGETDGRLFIAMEWARGPSLAQRIDKRGRIPWVEALVLLRPICVALDYAHGQGIVHRDLKPANILLDQERGPLLTDFGFARLVGTSSISLSISGGIAGTPGYIAPEVWELNAAAAPVDIYALGCIVYELLTGVALFRGQTPMQVMRAHDRGPKFPEAWPEDVPAGVEQALNKALARDPATRYPSAMALWHALNDLETRAQIDRQAKEKSAVTARWRAEAEAALAAGELSAARMAIGRWLTLAPDDPVALAARARLATLEPASGDRGGSTRNRKIPVWALLLGGLVALILVASVVRVLGSAADSPPTTPTASSDIGLIATAPPGSKTLAATAPAATATARSSTTPPAQATAPVVVPPTAPPTPTEAPPTPTPTEAPPAPTPTPTQTTSTGEGQIVFSSDRDERRGELYLINIDGSGLTRLTNSPGGDDEPAWSHDGSQIAFESDHDGEYDIYKMNADGSGRIRLTDNNVRDLSPSWSPDGGRIVFQSDRDTPKGSFNIYVMNADGSGQTRLTSSPGYDGCPDWSPDGETIAFARNQDGKVGIYLMKPDGSGQTLLAENGGCPVWSPDGRRIAFTARVGLSNNDIFVMNADGSGRTTLVSGPEIDCCPTWSPTGMRIAFDSRPGGVDEIYVMNADGSQQTNVTNSPTGDSHPAWRPHP